MFQRYEDVVVKGYELVELGFAVEFSVSREIEKGEESLGGLSLGSGIGSLAVGTSRMAVVRVSTHGEDASVPRPIIRCISG